MVDLSAWQDFKVFSGANPTTVSNNTTSSKVRFENKKKSSLKKRSTALQRCSFKF
jgi:hypothetical protein